MNKSAVISVGYPVDKSGHVQKLHATARASLQLISFQARSKKLDGCAQQVGWLASLSGLLCFLVLSRRLGLARPASALQVESSPDQSELITSGGGEG